MIPRRHRPILRLPPFFNLRAASPPDFPLVLPHPGGVSHRRVAARDLLPGAVFTVLSLIGLRIISTILLVHYLTTYATTYGALGIIMALFFWIILAATILVLAAALSPALAHRRDLLQPHL